MSERSGGRAARLLGAGLLRRAELVDKPPVERCGRYEILRALGQGGSGQVFLAWDPELEREVALKILTHALGADELSRFQREVRVLAGLDHPHIVSVLDVGTLGGGRPFVVLEYVQGGSLADAELDPRESARVVAQVARAVAAAHGQGVVHRDLKPANVLLSERGPLLADFGLAKLEDARITKDGAVLGTPSYMAPEQLEGEADALSDVYGLGAILYELLCGRPPVTGNHFTQVALRVSRGQITPLRERAPELDPALASIAERALAKEPGQRWASAAALGEALDAWLAGRGGAPRRRWPAVVAAVAVAVLVGGAGWAAASREATPAAPPTPAPTAQPSVDPAAWAAFQHALTEVALTQLGAPPQAPAGSGSTAVERGYLALAEGDHMGALAAFSEADGAAARQGEALSLVARSRVESLGEAALSLEAAVAAADQALQQQPGVVDGARVLATVCQELLYRSLDADFPLGDHRQAVAAAVQRVVAAEQGPAAWARGAAQAVATTAPDQATVRDLLPGIRARLEGGGLLVRAADADPDALTPRLLLVLLDLRQLDRMAEHGGPAVSRALGPLQVQCGERLAAVEALAPTHPWLPELRRRYAALGW